MAGARQVDTNGGFAGLALCHVVAERDGIVKAARLGLVCYLARVNRDSAQLVEQQTEGQGGEQGSGF